jgi:DNA-binding winged helix-turn-helix (wHTH) protein
MHLSGSADSVLLEGFRLDRRGGCLYRLDQGGGANPVALGPRAIKLLSELVEHRGELVSKDALMTGVWPGRAVEEANLHMQIANLRHILDKDRKHGSCIQTLAGRGYRFVGAVTVPDPRRVRLPLQHFQIAPSYVRVCRSWYCPLPISARTRSSDILRTALRTI